MKKENGATLSSEESSNFFRLFLPLLQAVNYNYEISDTLEEQLRAGRPSMRDLKEVAAALWEDTGILDEYIKAVSEQCGLPEEDRLVLESWGQRDVCLGAAPLQRIDFYQPRNRKGLLSQRTYTKMERDVSLGETTYCSGSNTHSVLRLHHIGRLCSTASGLPGARIQGEF